jgi:hypothetical protein
MLSINKAVRSFGLVAATGEIATVVAAVIVMPSVALLRSKSAKAPDSAADVALVGSASRE